MKKTIITAATLAICVSTAAQAQRRPAEIMVGRSVPTTQEQTAPAQQQTAPAQGPIAPAQTVNAVLRAGTPVALRLLEEVTTKAEAARVGQRIRMEVASDVIVNDVVVIPVGSPAECEVTSVRNKGMWGKSGHLAARALFTRVNGRQIRLSGTFDDKGVTGTAGVVASVALVPIVGFFVSGTSAVRPAGGEVPAFIDEDVELTLVSAAPAPMQVQVPAG
jgi:glucose/arabinose dehydrogenase